MTISDTFGDLNCTETLSGSNSAGCYYVSYSKVGTDVVTATYEGTSSYGSSSATYDVDVLPASISLSASVSAATVGQATTVSVTANPFPANDAGALRISDTLGALSCETTIAVGQCTSASFAAVGSDAITVSWAGNTDYEPVTTSATLEISRAETVIASVTAPASEVGQDATITIQVEPHPDGGTVAVSDQDGEVSGCGAVPVDTSTGQATCTSGSLSTADPSDVISAQYLGDENYAPSAVGTGSLDVERGTTQLTVTADPAPIVAGTATYIATLSPSPAVLAGGTVSFEDTSGMLTDCATQALDPTTNAATCESLEYDSTGSDTVSASFSGNANWAPSTGSQSFGVAPGQPNIAISVSPDQPSVGQQVTITAVVSPTDGGGTVSFSGPYLSGCSAVALSGDSASCTTATLTAVGTWTITSTYSGDKNYGSAFGGKTIPIAAAPTTVTIASSSTSPVAFGPDTLVATLSPVPDGGTVSFALSGASGPLPTCSGIAVNTSTGVASCSIAVLPGAGAETVTASYSGDTNYSPSSGELALAIGRVPTTLLMSVQPTSLDAGETATLTITVSPVPDGGTVSAHDSFSDLSCSDISVATTGTGAGQATCTTSPLSPAGTDALSFSYSGTSDYSPASGTGEIAVSLDPSTTNIAVAGSAGSTGPIGGNGSSGGEGVVGEDLMVQATVSPAPADGEVNFTDSLGQLGECASVPIDPSSGTATCTSGPLTKAGLDSISATFAGTSTEASSSGSEVVPIDAPPSFSGSPQLVAIVGSQSQASIEAIGYPMPVVSASEALPSGLSLAGDGTISGIPTEGSGGSYQLEVSATNVLGTVTKAMTLVVEQAPSISSSTDLEASYGTRASFEVMAAPGTWPLPSFALSGSLPSGLGLTDNANGTATIAGIPDGSASGVQRFSLLVSSSAGSVTVPFSIDVIGVPPAPSISMPSAPVPSPSRVAAIPFVPSTSITASSSSSSLAATLALYRAAAVKSSGREPSVIGRGALPGSFDPAAPVIEVRRHRHLLKVPLVSLGLDSRFPALGNASSAGDCTVVADSSIVRADHLLGKIRDVPAMSTKEALSQWRQLDAGTGAGLSDAELLHAWARRSGLLGTRLVGWRLLQTSDLAAMKRAIEVSGALYAGILLPSSGVVGNTVDPRMGATISVAGHALAIIGWTPRGFLGVSWGEVVLIPYSWWTRYSTSAYALAITEPSRPRERTMRAPKRRAR